MADHAGDHWCLWCAMMNARNPASAHRTCEDNQCCGWNVPIDRPVRCTATCACDHSEATGARHVADLLAGDAP